MKIWVIKDTYLGNMDKHPLNSNSYINNNNRSHNHDEPPPLVIDEKPPFLIWRNRRSLMPTPAPHNHPIPRRQTSPDILCQPAQDAILTMNKYTLSSILATLPEEDVHKLREEYVKIGKFNPIGYPTALQLAQQFPSWTDPKGNLVRRILVDMGITAEILDPTINGLSDRLENLSNDMVNEFKLRWMTDSGCVPIYESIRTGQELAIFFSNKNLQIRSKIREILSKVEGEEKFEKFKIDEDATKEWETKLATKEEVTTINEEISNPVCIPVSETDHPLSDFLEISNDNLTDNEKTSVKDLNASVRVSNLNASIRNLDQCIVCMDYERNAVFLPCGHMACCFKCGDSIAKSAKICPVCRIKITLCTKIFKV